MTRYAEEVGCRGTLAYAFIDPYTLEAEARGQHVVNLFHGNGALPPPQGIVAGIIGLADQIERWTPTGNRGGNVRLQDYRPPPVITMPELIKAIQDDFARDVTNVERENVVVHTGAGTTQLAAAVFNHFKACAPGEHPLMMFAPTYTALLGSASALGLDVNLIPPATNGMVTPEHIERALTQHPDTRTIFLVHPNNPTGQDYTKEELEQISRSCIKRNVAVVTDEVFHNLRIEPDRKFVPIASIEVDGHKMFDRTITLRGLSKDRGLAATRIGWAAGPEKLMSEIAANRFTYYTSFNLDDIAQYMALVALRNTPDEYFSRQNELLHTNAHLVASKIKDINEESKSEILRAEIPSSGMFMVVDCGALRGTSFDGQTIGTDMELAKAILENANVGLLPASVGGYDPEDIKLRLTISSPTEEIDLGMEQLKKFVLNLDFFPNAAACGIGASTRT